MTESTKVDAPTTRQRFINSDGTLTDYGHIHLSASWKRSGGWDDYTARAMAIGFTGLAQAAQVERNVTRVEREAKRAVSLALAARADPRLDMAVEALSTAVQALGVALARSSSETRNRLDRTDSLLSSLGGRATRAQQILNDMAERVSRDIKDGSRNQVHFLQRQASEIEDIAREIRLIEDDVAGLTTDDITEGLTNLYYTGERVDDRVSVLIQNGTGISWTYDDGAGTLTPAVSLSTFTTANLTENTNLYYTNARADARIAAAVGVSVQAYDADLGALAANGTNGLWTRTGAGTGSARTLTGTASELTVTNGDGVSGNPTLSLPAALTFTGKTVTGGTFSGVTLSGTTTLPGTGALDSSGNLGLGSASPGAKLHVIGASGDQLRLGTAATEEYRLGRDSGTGLMNFYGTQSGFTGYVFTGVDGEIARMTGTTLECTNFRINQSPTADAVAQTHHVPININGSTYKLLLAS